MIILIGGDYSFSGIFIYLITLNNLVLDFTSTAALLLPGRFQQFIARFLIFLIVDDIIDDIANADLIGFLIVFRIDSFAHRSTSSASPIISVIILAGLKFQVSLFQFRIFLPLLHLLLLSPQFFYFSFLALADVQVHFFL